MFTGNLLLVSKKLCAYQFYELLSMSQLLVNQYTQLNGSRGLFPAKLTPLLNKLLKIMSRLTKAKTSRITRVHSGVCNRLLKL